MRFPLLVAVLAGGCGPVDHQGRREAAADLVQLAPGPLARAFPLTSGEGNDGAPSRAPR